MHVVDISVHWKHKHVGGDFTSCIWWKTIPTWQQPMFNSTSVVGVAREGYKGKFVNINYSTSVPHFKIRLFPRDYYDNLMFEFPPPKTNKLIELGLGNLKGMESKRDEGQSTIRVPP